MCVCVCMLHVCVCLCIFVVYYHGDHHIFLRFKKGYHENVLILVKAPMATPWQNTHNGVVL